MPVVIMIRKSLLLFILLLVGVLIDSKAQNVATITTSMDVIISDVADLSVSPSTTLSFDFTTTPQIDAGIPRLAAHTLTYKSNKDWYITIKAKISGNFSGGNTSFQMPVSKLKYKLSTSGIYTAVTASEQTLSGTALSKNPRGTGTIVVDFLMDPTYVSYPAQDYSVTITYTISN